MVISRPAVSLLACAWLFRGIDTYGAAFLTLTFTVGAITAECTVTREEVSGSIAADARAVELSHGPGYDYQPDWSPDGSRLAFATRGGATEPLYEYDMQTQRTRQLFERIDAEVAPMREKYEALLAQGTRDLWVNPPPIPLTTDEMDAVFDLPYARSPHPAYADELLRSLDAYLNARRRHAEAGIQQGGRAVAEMLDQRPGRQQALARPALRHEGDELGRQHDLVVCADQRDTFTTLSVPAMTRLRLAERQFLRLPMPRLVVLGRKVAPLLLHRVRAPAQLAERHCCGRSNVTALIDRLEKVGHIHRTKDADDRRRVVLDLDGDGQVFTVDGGLSA